jgi:hypothetical protein
VAELLPSTYVWRAFLIVALASLLGFEHGGAWWVIAGGYVFIGLTEWGRDVRNRNDGSNGTETTVRR